MTILDIVETVFLIGVIVVGVGSFMWIIFFKKD